jgi:hypothetical protein
LFSLAPSDVPFVSKAYLLKKLSLKMETVFAICPYYEKSSFASFEGGVGKVLGSAGSQQHALEQ